VSEPNPLEIAASFLKANEGTDLGALGHALLIAYQMLQYKEVAVLAKQHQVGDSSTSQSLSVSSWRFLPTA
jgi:hypothetical protein